MNRFKSLITLILVIGSLSSNSQSLEDGLYATIYTEDHQMIIKLFDKKTPMAVANFVGLAEGSISNEAFEEGRPFYDGSSFDRVVPGHVIQGGVPNSTKSRSAGYTIPNEIHPELGHSRAGMLGMANAGPDTGGNVFYITLDDRSYLDGDYTVFGELLDTPPQYLEVNTRIDSIRIVRIGSDAEAYYVNDELLAKLIADVERNNAIEEEKKAQLEQDYILENYPEIENSKFGWRFQVLQKGKGKKVRKLNNINLRYTGTTIQGTQFGSTDICSSYWLLDGSPATCQYFPNISKIVTGLDEAILEMRQGAKWILILEPEQAYGTSGFYPPLDWGDKRFHISPNTTIIYEIDVLN